MQNGKRIPAIVKEVGVNEILFEKIGEVDAALSSVNYFDVKFIKYRNGSTDTIDRKDLSESTQMFNCAQHDNFDPCPEIRQNETEYFIGSRSVTEREVLKQIKKMKDPDINHHISIKRGANVANFVTLFVGLGALGCAIAAATDTRGDFVAFGSPVVLLICSSVAVNILGLCINSIYIKKVEKERAIRIYNQKY